MGEVDESARANEGSIQRFEEVAALLAEEAESMRAEVRRFRT